MISNQKVEKWAEQVDGMLAEVKIKIDEKNYPSEIIPLMETLKSLKEIKNKLSVLQVIIKNKGGVENEI